MHIHVHVHVRVCRHTLIHIFYIYTYMQLCGRSIYTGMYMYIQVCIYMYVYMQLHICKGRYMYVSALI